MIISQDAGEETSYAFLLEAFILSPVMVLLNCPNFFLKVLIGGLPLLFENKVFIGIDPTAGEKPMIYAALDQERSLLALGNGGLDDVLAFTGGQHNAVVAICAPQKPNAQIMSQREVREKLSPTPGSGSLGKLPPCRLFASSAPHFYISYPCKR